MNNSDQAMKDIQQGINAKIAQRTNHVAADLDEQILKLKVMIKAQDQTLRVSAQKVNEVEKIGKSVKEESEANKNLLTALRAQIKQLQGADPANKSLNSGPPQQQTAALVQQQTQDNLPKYNYGPEIKELKQQIVFLQKNMFRAPRGNSPEPGETSKLRRQFQQDIQQATNAVLNQVADVRGELNQLRVPLNRKI